MSRLRVSEGHCYYCTFTRTLTYYYYCNDHNYNYHSYHSYHHSRRECVAWGLDMQGVWRPQLRVKVSLQGLLSA